MDNNKRRRKKRRRQTRRSWFKKKEKKKGFYYYVSVFLHLRQFCVERACHCFLVFRCRGEHISLDLFSFVNLSRIRSLILQHWSNTGSRHFMSLIAMQMTHCCRVRERRITHEMGTGISRDPMAEAAARALVSLTQSCRLILWHFKDRHWVHRLRLTRYGSWISNQR